MTEPSGDLEKRARRRRTNKVILAVFLGLAVLLIIVIAGLSAFGGSSSDYPPRSMSDLRALAGSSSANLPITHREWHAACECFSRITVRVPSTLSGGAQAAALLRVFFAYHLDHPPRDMGLSTMVFGVKNPKALFYDGGRVIRDINVQSNQATITVDINRGSPEYTVTQKPSPSP